ncbi:AAA family ATPase [bacterium]|jgi:hypothetical protein|nr:AAA family ATPase [bacterium]
MNDIHDFKKDACSLYEKPSPGATRFSERTSNEEPYSKPRPNYFCSTEMPVLKKGESIQGAINSQSFFSTKTAADWIEIAKLKPIPQQLCGTLWFEGEICILFADTNLGKSILAVNIADSITNSMDILFFEPKVDKQVVLYIDCELSDKQFQLRYTEESTGKTYKFSNNFLRAELNPDNVDFDYTTPIDEQIVDAIETLVIQHKTKIIIIDNITYLKEDNEKARDAAPFMKRLKELKLEYNLSILVLAHTPKRDASRPLSQNDIAGSKMLMNFVDSAFAIGRSMKDSRLRYIKQIKIRNGEEKYGDDNIILCDIRKEESYLHFSFIDHDSEINHLKPPSRKNKSEMIEKANQLRAQGSNQREIAEKLGVALGTANKYLKKGDQL